MNKLLVATRKGLFRIELANKAVQQELIGFVGDPVCQLLSDRRDGALYAALNLGHFGPKLHRSSDAGKTWEEIAVPMYPKADPGDEAKAVSLVQIWSLAMAGESAGELWAGTIPGGLFHSSDGGQSWSLNRSLWDREERASWFGGGYDAAGIHSVCVDPRDSKRVAVGVSCGGVWLTEDGGKSWEVRTRGMFADYMPEEQREDSSIQDPHLIVQCPGQPDHYWCQHHNGIFRSRDNLKSWENVTNAVPSDFGFAVAVHPEDPETAWFVPAKKDMCRVPVDGKFVVSRTRDGGQSFEVLSHGLPQTAAYDLVYRHALAIDASGECLAIGSTTGSLWVSDNGGEAWRLINAHLPPIFALAFE